MGKEIYVVKMSGKKVPYDQEKLRNSMARAGANEEVIEKILKKADNFVQNGMKTKKLFRFVFAELKKDKSIAGIKYNLKQSLIDLHVRGEGYVYEKFMAKVLENQNYTTEINQIVEGKFIPHEIDIIAKKKSEVLMVEAKHHSRPWLGTEIQTALYIYARFLDAKKNFTQPMLVTNTKFSPQVIQYSKGVGIRLMGWNYPQGDSLIENIEKYKLYPITILELKKEEIENYLKRNIITIEELLKEKDLDKITKEKIGKILQNN